jgi:hypothetical protein
MYQIAIGFKLAFAFIFGVKQNRYRNAESVGNLD